MRNWIGCALACGLLACNGNGNKNNQGGDLADSMNGGGNFAAVSRTVVVTAGAECANGGSRVDIGLDNGDGGGTARDGVLQDGEVDKSELVCAPAPSTYATVTKTTPLAYGDVKCPYGGGKVEYGVDDGANGSIANNGTLEVGEIDGTTYSCVPKPDNLLVQTTAIAAGGDPCPYGGQRVQSGFDDGEPSGTKGNGLLEPDEIDLDQNRCNADPTALFPAPTGPVGSEVLDGAGGTGAGSAAGGGGGHATIAVYGGPRAAAVELRNNGTITPTIATPTATYAAAAHEVFLTSTDVPIVIPASATPLATGLYVYGDPNSALQALPLYDGPNEVGSLHVGPGVTVVFEDTTDFNEVVVKLEGDLRNEGIITTKASDSDAHVDLHLQAHHILNDASGTFDNRNAAVRLFALRGTGGALVNRGTITTRGWDEGERSDAAESAPARGGDLILVSVTGIYNLGAAVLSCRGGLRADTDERSAYGGNLSTYVIAGSFYNSGTVDGRGGAGADGWPGGQLGFASGPIPDMFLASVDSSNKAPAILRDSSQRGAGGWESSGTIDASGGSAPGIGNGGSAGVIFVRSVGGSIRSSGGLLANGGDGRQSGCCSSAGSGGMIWLGSFTYVAPIGSVIVPDEIGVSGKLQFRGGAVQKLAGSPLGTGGSGGNLTVRLDLTLVGDPVPQGPTITADSMSPYEIRAFDTTQLQSPTQTARVRLLGFGGGVHLNAADGGSGGAGGNLEIANDVCSAKTVQCAFVHVGSRLIHSDLVHDLSGGAGSDLGDAGGGGYHTVSLRSLYNGVAGSYDSSRIELNEVVDVSGGSNEGSTGGNGGYCFVQSDIGDVSFAKQILATGGDSPKPGGGGQSGTISVGGFGVTLNGDLNADAGTNHQNFASTISVDGYRVAIKGDVKMKSNWNRQIRLSAFDTLDVTGDILADSMPGPHSATIALTAKTATTTGAISSIGASGAYGEANAGGSLTFRGVSWTNSGAITLSGGNVTCSDGVQCFGSQGGAIDAPGLHNSGAITLNGGNATGSGNKVFASSAGAIVLTSNSGVVTGRGGSSTTNGTNSAFAGSGADLQFTTNSGAISADGGDATSDSGQAFAGNGGTVTGQDNTAPISLRAGTATTSGSKFGSGGTATLVTNTACIDVFGAQGDGTVNGPNVCL